ncbi:MAG: cysteine desulfurase NifS [Lachnospiraceae bacterium]|nr:cysteine desulfurase NifS [Lachnospiraceae bacterium]
MESAMIYLDHAATTKTAPEVVEAMLPYFTECYGNAGSIYKLGNESRMAVIRTKETIAGTLGAEANEIYFTSGGTESDNWALKAVYEAYRDKGRHIITSKIEHHAVLHTCEYLEKQGAEVTYLDVDGDGLVDVEQLKRAIRPDTILISVMYANNEIGTLQPVKEIGEIAASHGILFHTDAVQAYGQLPIDVAACHIDLLSASGHKFNGPKGVGFLYVSKRAKIRSFMHGGQQERGRRAGTENIPGIVGLEAAVRRVYGSVEEAECVCNLEEEKNAERERILRDYLISQIEEKIPAAVLNGHRTKRLPGNVNFSFPGVEGESVLIMLDMQGICASSGSACTSGSIDPSHVLLAIGRSPEEARSAIRLTLGAENTKEEMDIVVGELARIVGKIRESRL